MKPLILMAALFCASCTVVADDYNKPAKLQPKYKEYVARVTYYWGDTITSRGTKPVCGKTLAVDPKIIPYGSRVEIPEMGCTFISSDTGPAVKSRLASKRLGKNHIVVDVFCGSSAKAKERIKKYPMFMKIRVLENE